jgi:hypothetical protein
LLLGEVVFLSEIGRKNHPERKGFYSECVEEFLSHRVLASVSTVKRHLQKLKRLQLLLIIHRRPENGKRQTNLLVPTSLGMTY